MSRPFNPKNRFSLSSEGREGWWGPLRGSKIRDVRKSQVESQDVLPFGTGTHSTWG